MTIERDGVFSRGRFVETERRRDGGVSVNNVERGSVEVSACDDFSALPIPSYVLHKPDEIEQQLIHAVEEFEVLPLISHTADLRMRHVVTARFAANERGFAHFGRSESFLLSAVGGGPVLVSTRATLADDLTLLETLGQPAVRHDCDTSRLPIVWRNGTGGVLLHEIIGHPSQHSVETGSMRELQMRDVPQYGGLLQMEVDDSGSSTAETRFAAGGTLLPWRRADFRHPVLRRMTNLVVDPPGETYETPQTRIEVLHVSAGDYDPLFDRVRLHVSRADLVTGDDRAAVAPFVVRSRRGSIAGAIRGAAGDLVRFPGVLCSDQGQRIICGTWSPDLLTAPFSPA